MEIGPLQCFDDDFRSLQCAILSLKRLNMPATWSISVLLKAPLNESYSVLASDAGQRTSFLKARSSSASMPGKNSTAGVGCVSLMLFNGGGFETVPRTS